MFHVAQTTRNHAGGRCSLRRCGFRTRFGQSGSCADQYNRVTALYQTAPLSPEYGQMAANYSARCLAGAPAAPAYYGSTGYGYNSPAYYGYGYNAPVYYGPGYLPHTSQHGTVQ